MSDSHFLFNKIQFNNLNLDYPNILTKKTDFYFPKLYSSPLIGAKIECINKQLLVDINWSNKAIWKSALNKATKEILIFGYEIVCNLNCFRKHRILLFFIMARCDTIRKHVAEFFNHSVELFKHLA